MPNQINREIKIFVSKDWLAETEVSGGRNAYQLLDTGEGEKLEKFGPYTFVRPYENAVWQKTLKELEWSKADGKFFSSKGGGKGGLASLKQRESGWKMQNKIEEKWPMQYKGIKFWASPTPFRHLGFFPEQASHWDFIETMIGQALKNRANPAALPASGLRHGQDLPYSSGVKFLNLFGYTGVASLFALRAGADVTHLDASKQSLNWAKENQKLNSELIDAPMRVIEDDVIKFLEREVKRGNKYDAIIMDPPKFGRGPKGEVWKIEEMLPKLLAAVRKVLSDQPLFVILTSYAIDSSSLPLAYALEEMMKDFKGHTEAGELCVLEAGTGRVIPLANTAVWGI